MKMSRIVDLNSTGSVDSQQETLKWFEDMPVDT